MATTDGLCGVRPGHLPFRCGGSLVLSGGVQHSKAAPFAPDRIERPGGRNDDLLRRPDGNPAARNPGASHDLAAVESNGPADGPSKCLQKPVHPHQLRECVGQLRNVPFLFITAYGSRDSHLQARRLGCDDFLTKPLDFELLVANSI